jgi:hypothetical protein
MRRRPHLIPALVVAVMLLVGLLVGIIPLPPVYFKVLEWLTAVVAVFIAIEAVIWKEYWAGALFFLIAFVFNPIVSPPVLHSVMIVCSILFVLAAIFLEKPAQSEHKTLN